VFLVEVEVGVLDVLEPRRAVGWLVRVPVLQAQPEESGVGGEHEDGHEHGGSQGAIV
jgi:hypothetical protein